MLGFVRRKIVIKGRSISLGAILVSLGITLLLSGAAYARLGGSAEPTSGTIDLQKGLLGWWKLDGNTKDATPYARNGTAAGSPEPAVDRHEVASGAYSFGGGDFIDAGTGPITGTNAFTMAAWINSAQMSNYSGAFAMGPSAGGQAAYIGTVNAAQSGTGNSIGGGFYGYNIGSGVTTTNDWVHVAMTYEAGVAKLYIDGTLTNTVSYTPSMGAGTLRIGRIGTDTIYDFNGAVDDVRLYNRALTAAEAQALHASEGGGVKLASGQKGLVGWWKFDGDRKDATPYGNNLTVTNASFIVDRKAGAAKAMRFTGSSNSHASTSIGAAQKPTNALTFSAWAKKQGSGGNSPRGLLMSSSGSYIDECYNGNILFSLVLSTGQKLISGGSCPTTGSGWHHYVGTYDGTVAKLYKDGVEVASLATTGQVQYNSNPFTIGCYDGGAYCFNGDIDDVRIYNRSLSPSEVERQYKSYNSQISLHLGDETPPPTINLSQGLIGYWPFNGNLNDATPYSRNGTNSNATLTTDRQGQSNKAYYFNGTNASVGVLGFTSYPGAGTTDELTYCAWVKGVTNRSVVRQQDGGNSFLILNWASGNLNLVSWDGWTSGLASGLPNDNAWHLGCLVWERNTVNGFRSYADGAVVAQRDSTDVAIPTSSPTLYIGSYIGVSEYHEGAIDDVRIWERALSTAEVEALYSLYQ